MHRLFIYLSLMIQLVIVCLGCVEPVPDYLTEIDETDGSGTVILTMSEPPSSSPSTWFISITNPTIHATYFEEFFIVTSTNGSAPEWTVALAKPLDIEMIRKDKNFTLSDLTLDVLCSNANTQSVIHYQRTVVVRAISEFSPVFDNPLPRFNVTEESSLETVVVSLKNYVIDRDVQNNGQPSDIVKFSTQPYIGNDLVNGNDVFEVITMGDVILKKSLDYENGGLPFGLNVTVEDTGGRVAWSIIAIAVVNANDNPPMFIIKSEKGHMQQVAEYRATVDDTYVGQLRLDPGPIETTDPDNDVIRYYIKTGYPDDYISYISLDELLGTVSLTHPVKDPSISHFTLVIEVISGICIDVHRRRALICKSDNPIRDGLIVVMEISNNVKLNARDGLRTKRSEDAINKVHTATASLLVFVSGRNVNFPGTPRSGSSSSIASVNTDALFIGVIVLSSLSFLLLIIVIVLCCKIKKKNGHRDTFPGVERCNTLKDRKPSDWSVQMRPVERGNSEKAFIRSLSRSTPYVNEGFVNDKANDDVFVTGITPYTNVQINAQRYGPQISDQDAISRGIMPYNEEGVNSTLAARHSALTLPRGAPLSSPAVSFATSSNSAPNRPSINVQNSFESLDLLTSVKPITEDDTRPLEIIPHNNNTNTTGDKRLLMEANNDTLRSLNSADVMNELDQIIFNENQYHSDRDEKVTHFMNNSTTDTRGSEDKHGNEEEGITSFNKDSIEFGVMPFDHNLTGRSVKTFHFPGEQILSSPGSPGSSLRNDPVLYSADMYYRQNSGSQLKK